MKTLVCEKCGKEVQAESHQSILSCHRILSPYKKKDQDTKSIGHTHGLGVPGRLAWNPKLYFPIGRVA